MTARCEAQVRRHAAINPEEPGYYEKGVCGRLATDAVTVGKRPVPLCSAHRAKLAKLLWPR